MFFPKSSINIILEAIGVFVTLARRFIMPIADKVALSKCKKLARKFPAVDPIKKIGVIIPPLPPKLSVIIVKIIFTRKKYHAILSPLRARSIVSMPSPRKFLEKMRVKSTSILPPMSPLTGFHIFNFLYISSKKFRVSINIMETSPKNIPAMIASAKCNSLKE